MMFWSGVEKRAIGSANETYFESDFCQLLLNIFLPLKIAEFFIELSEAVRYSWVTLKETLTVATTSVPISGMYLFNVAINRE